MKTPYGLPIIDDCMSCTNIVQNGFCDLPDSSRAAWNAVRHNSSYPRGAVLFVQGQPASGAHVVCMGQVKLYSTAGNGATLIHRICGPGDVAGMGESVLGAPYETTAETISPAVLNHVRCEDLLRLLRTDSTIAVRMASRLSLHLAGACRQLQDQRFQQGAIEKMAAFLLAACNHQSRISLSLTHEEIGEIIGLARETVTRSLREMKERNIIRIGGHLISVVDREALSAMAGR